MPELNVHILTDHNYSELLGNKFGFAHPKFLCIYKLFQWGQSYFLNRVYVIHNKTLLLKCLQFLL